MAKYFITYEYKMLHIINTYFNESHALQQLELLQLRHYGKLTSLC